MKKLLYTFLIGLLVISCDKNEESFEAPLSIEEAKVVSEEEALDLVNSVLDGTFSTSKKGDVVTGKGNDYVRVLVFSQGENKYLTLTDESNDDLCADSVTPFEMFFDNSAGDGSVISVEAPEGTVVLTLSGNFAGFFSGGLNSIQKTDSSGNRTSMNFDDSNSATFTE